MTAVPVLGDFLAAAHGHLDDPGSPAGTAAPGRDIEEVTGSLLRFLSVASRYASDADTAFGEMPDHLRRAHGAWRHAATKILADLAAASLALVPAEQRPPPPARGASCPQARRLDAAVAALTAGRDLVQLHFAAARRGRARRSEWAPVIASPDVSAALLAEITALAGRAASMVADTPAIRGRKVTASAEARRLGLACQLLTQAEATRRTALRREPVPAASRELLYAIPATALPARRIPGAGSGVPELCEAITATAGRARHAAWRAGQADAESPGICVTSWRRIAISGVAASRHCRLVLTGLAERTDDLGDQETSLRMRIAAGGARTAYRAWVLSARELSEVTTDVRERVSRASVEAGDLALLTGRLAYARPGWTLSSGSDQPVRAAGDLAPAAGDIAGVLAAVHYAADSLAWLARANSRQARAAVTARRILIPARSADPVRGGLGSFAQPSGERTLDFLRASRNIQAASVRHSVSLGEIAVAMGAPSRILVAARATVGTERRGTVAVEIPGPHLAGTPDVRTGTARADVWRGGDQDLAGPFEARLRELGVTGQRYLGRAASIDRSGQQVIAEAATDVLRRPVLSAGRVQRAGMAELPGRPAARRPPAACLSQPELEAEP